MYNEGQYLAIDIGNNRGKAVLFFGPRIVKRFVFSSREPDSFIEEIKTLPIGIPAAISMVKNPDDSLLQSLASHTQLVVVNGLTTSPLMMDYALPQSLGPDRLTAAIGAATMFPEQDILVVDAGTCITADIVTKDGHYLGGSISPGIKMRLQAMHQNTERLPMIEVDEGIEMIGIDTATSIGSGALMGSVTEIEGRVLRLRKQYPKLRVVLTGGDAFLLCRKINCNIFVMPDLVFLGLRAILLYDENIKN